MPFIAGNPDLADPAAEVVNIDIDPFADWVFREPRQPQFSVRELNDAALKRLLVRFDRLIAGPLPRPGRRVDQAQLIVSPQPGYGKSHLVGRLFTALEGRATLIHAAPFHSPGLCWQSLLLRMVQELTLPERRPEDASQTAPSSAGEPPTQLDAFAHGILAHLVAGLIESGKAHHPDPAGAAAWLRENPMDAFSLSRPEHPWAQWLHEMFGAFHHDMEAILRRAGISMHSPGWLRVLFRYAASPPGDEARALCLAWMSGQPLEPAEAALIGLRAGESIPVETPDQFNEVCWRRLVDFCQLAAFYRPFVFCFDRAEAYGHSTALARCFGMMIAQIHLMAANVMMVITANQPPWEEAVARHMETADKDRFSLLSLEGLRRVQAEELIRRRCRQHDVPGAQIEAFLDPGWLAIRFPTERNRMGTRQFLQICSARWQNSQEWWQDRSATTPELPFGPVAPGLSAPLTPLFPPSRPSVIKRVIPRIGAPPSDSEGAPKIVGQPPLVSVPRPEPVPLAAVKMEAAPAEAAPLKATLSLDELHDRYTRDLAAQPQRLLYHPDTLRWLVGEVAAGCPGLTVDAPGDGPRGYLPVVWNVRADDAAGTPAQVLFGFESGDNWKRWRSILREVQDRCLPPPLAPAAGQAVPPCKAVFLRTPEQSALPGLGWEIGAELESAKQTCFDVIELEEAGVAQLYASRNLYLDAVTGALPYSAEEVLTFLRKELQPFWERAQAPMPGEPEMVFSGDTWDEAT